MTKSKFSVFSFTALVCIFSWVGPSIDAATQCYQCTSQAQWGGNKCRTIVSCPNSCAELIVKVNGLRKLDQFCTHGAPNPVGKREYTCVKSGELSKYQSELNPGNPLLGHCICDHDFCNKGDVVKRVEGNRLKTDDNPAPDLSKTA